MTIGRVLGVLLCSTGALGCIDMAGFPPAEYYEDPLVHDDPFFDEDEGPSLCDFEETEPNDGDGDYEYDTLGALLSGRQLTVCGRVSSSGTNNAGYYTGDADFFTFELLSSEDVTVELHWEGSTDLDLHLISWYTDYLESSWDDQPERIHDPLSAGIHWIEVVAATGSAADYQLRVDVQ